MGVLFEMEDKPLSQRLKDKEEREKGCGVLFMFEGGSGIIICGQKRLDGNCFLCQRCLKEKKGAKK